MVGEIVSLSAIFLFFVSEEDIPFNKVIPVFK